MSGWHRIHEDWITPEQGTLFLCIYKGEIPCYNMILSDSFARNYGQTSQKYKPHGDPRV